jgi:hypothetical protein
MSNAVHRRPRLALLALRGLPLLLLLVVAAPAEAALSSGPAPPPSPPPSAPPSPPTPAAEPAPPPPPTGPEATTGEATLGVLLNAGNVAGAAGRLGAFVTTRTGPHALRLDVALGIAAYAVDADANPTNGFSRIDAGGAVVAASPLDAINTTALARLRYDLFIDDDDSVFAAPLVLHDSAMNLRLRVRTDVGWRHFFFAGAAQALSAEFGASWSIDNAIFAVDDADTNGDGRVSVWGDQTAWEETGGVLAARVAAAYDLTLGDGVAFHQTVEVIPNLSFGPDLLVVGDVAAPYAPARTGGADDLGFAEATIVNAVSSLVLRLGATTSLGVNLAVLWDNGAVARRNAMTNYDVALALQLAVRAP